MCRYCFEGEEDGELVAPCHCAGGQKWVHLSCLRRWQRGVLGSLPTHPDLHTPENRQRVCNICNSPFTVPPPTHLELLSSYASGEVAELVAEGSLIGAHRDFSEALTRQVAALPQILHDGIGHRHWIGGLFYVLRVSANQTRTVRLRIDDAEDLETFSRRLEAGWNFEMQGRQLQIAREGPLADTDVPEDADTSAIRSAVRRLTAPLTLTLRGTAPPDEGEDGVVAVNLTRQLKLQRSVDAYKRAAFSAAVRAVLERECDEALLAEVSHLLGGPCDEDEAACCIVVGGTTEPFTVHHGLLSGLREAQGRAKAARARSEENGIEFAVPKHCDGLIPSATEASQTSPPTPPAAKRRRGDSPVASLARRSESEEPPDSQSAGNTATQDEPSERTGADAAETPAAEGASLKGSPIHLLVFWGSAGWSRRQLLGEVARGSWGLCRSLPEDVTSAAPSQLWDSVYPRLKFAPKSDLTENYAARWAGGQEDDERATLQLAAMRQLLEYRQLSRQRPDLQRRVHLLRQFGQATESPVVESTEQAAPSDEEVAQDDRSGPGSAAEEESAEASNPDGWVTPELFLSG